MMNERNTMLDKIIRRFGFENCRTITFALRCEHAPQTNAAQAQLIHLFHDLMNLPISTED